MPRISFAVPDFLIEKIYCAAAEKRLVQLDVTETKNLAEYLSSVEKLFAELTWKGGEYGKQGFYFSANGDPL